MKEYIEREALFEVVRDKSITQFDWSEKVDLEEFEEVLNNIPAADVAPVRRGEWKPVFIRCRPDEAAVRHEKCTVCGTIKCERTNYCPNCGARIDGGK